MTARRNLVSHTLIGRRVVWEGMLWLVTGASRAPGRHSLVAFRLQGQNSKTTGTERWTGYRPVFAAIEGDGPPALRQHLSLLVAMLKRCEPGVPHAHRTTDDEWTMALAGAEAALALREPPTCAR